MNKKKAGVAFIVLLTCAFGWSSIGAGPRIQSNADDLAKIRSVLENS